MNYCRETMKLGTRLRDLAERREREEDGRATRYPQGDGSEAYLEGTSQGPTPEDAWKDGHIRGRSKRFMKHPDYKGPRCTEVGSESRTSPLPT